MPFFSRRRIQSMLIDLSNHMPSEKAQDLIRRLNNKKVDQFIPAEIELAVLWAIEKTGDLVIEPEWWASNKRPDAYSESLIPNHPTIIEIATHSDGRISFEDVMDKVTLVVCKFASSKMKGIGEYLYFTFSVKHDYSATESPRTVLATKNYKMSANTCRIIENWISNDTKIKDPINIIDAGNEYRIEKRDEKQRRHFNYFTSMPPETYSEKINPLFELLKRKMKQIGDAPANTKRVIFIADAGSTLLHSIGNRRRTRAISGEQIIQRFLDEYKDRIDVVVTMVARSNSRKFFSSDLTWQISVFKSPMFEGNLETLEQIEKKFPNPLFEGYQIRSLAKQNAFDPQSLGWYVGMNETTKKGGNSVTIKVSARALLEFLAGKTDEAHLRSRIDSGLFLSRFKNGETLVNVSMEPRAIDQEDDYLVLEFEKDPAASKFVSNK